MGKMRLAINLHEEDLELCTKYAFRINIQRHDSLMRYCLTLSRLPLTFDMISGACSTNMSGCLPIIAITALVKSKTNSLSF